MNQLMMRHLTYQNGYGDFAMIPCGTSVNQQPQAAAESLHCSMGALDRLPPEIMLQVLADLDLESLLAFKAMNARSKESVDYMLYYKNLMDQAPGVLQAFVDTGLAKTISPRQLFVLLKSRTCVGCGDFAPFLHTLSLTRRCHDCLFHDNSLRAITVSAARACYGLNAQDMRTLPTLLSIPGIYGDLRGVFRNLQTRRLHLVSEAQALALGIARYGTQANMQSHLNGLRQEKLAAYEQKMTVWRNSAGAGRKKPTKPRSLAINLDTRGMVSVPFPVFNVQDGSSHNGVLCTACKNHFLAFPLAALANPQMTVLERLRFTSYSESGFFTHFEQCTEAKLLWSQVCN